MTRIPLTPESTLPRGSIAALITPFTRDGRVDKVALKKLIDFHVESCTAAVSVTGTTGESSTLSHAEHRDVIATAVEHAAGRIHVMAGVGANSTAEAVALAKFASDNGATSLLSVVPYYNKPSPQGLVDHFLAQADVSAVPLVLYNVPGRTVTDLSVSAVVKLSRHPNIRGLKDATGDMARAAEMLEAIPSGFALYSGDDFTSFPYLTLGGWGVISVLANIAPQQVAELCRHVEAGEMPLARDLFLRLLPMTRALFTETSPTPVKYAASLMGHCEPDVRLPLCMPEEATKRLIEQHVDGAIKNVA
ncbi:4-hydroxy-tetrahydrodipicolinate synthase [Paraburkholderia aspalathi]|uniref:4-hydroxy-tetrahydrodipicolinate synthase n=1 Tax=Paraburkholderia aspalathi TaxID=1324617 RepID=UPI00190D363B|nr:4-hydroxy-tetrahydrodipicolinate synthase [Paraburkholderia aspalathi]MBK3842075.1 4-hydroxy-tetrahydrodipicolinate synthase [Paraburkholderia aspalathi]CAE6819994.1 4-hydroxy-tetrahydrodipicolinate synthase [Paraburkholderia aspalathi]